MKNMLLAIGISAVLTACGGGGDDSGCEVTYEVEGRNTQQRVLITMSPSAGKPLQGTFQVYPQSHRETYQFKEGDFLYISGQNANSWNAAFEVRIVSNGKVVAQNSGFGYSVASAEATCR